MREEETRGPFEVVATETDIRGSRSTPHRYTTDSDSGSKPPFHFSNVNSEPTSGEPTGARFPNHTRKTPPRIPIEKIKRRTISRGGPQGAGHHYSSSSKLSVNPMDDYQQRRASGGGPAIYYKYRRQPTGSERFSPRMSRLRIDTAGSPMSS